MSVFCMIFRSWATMLFPKDDLLLSPYLSGFPILSAMSPSLFNCGLMSRSLVSWFFLPLWFISSPYTVTAPGCFYAFNSTVLPSPDFVEPCGVSNPSAEPSFVNCCVLQSQNICLSSSICYEPYTDDGKYYLSPCTDPDYNASVCPKYCSKSQSYHSPAPSIFFFPVEDLMLTSRTIRRSAPVSPEPTRHHLRPYCSDLEVLWDERREVGLQ